MTTSVTLAAHAKVNLFLRVLAREDSGYHGLETLFCLVSLADRLRAERRDGHAITLDVEGAECGPPEQNLAVRAANLVLAATGRRFGVHLTLEKAIPVQGGLGGGSSDAAAALLAVNALAAQAVPRHELLQFAARLGSDVPFFVAGGPLALAWGHGERLLRLPPLPSAPALLLQPPVGVSTPDAYRQVDAARQGAGARGAVALDLEALQGWGSIGRLAGNDFEFALFGRVPELRQAFEALAGTHPLLCRMSGSGSTLFAVYRTARDRDEARQQLPPRLGRVIPVETLAAPPAPPDTA
ncbi:MAG: 4-(cytidine 5'-diphospho)-2-C-methyl-D-erythritol kinase [Gemmatimonadetes bacterium]|nr:4-(cytidine 5'-diphospho)-2-C-methyl-D-erythritol kinase [Gemmatimonadota bacterium]MBK7783632.1 4-(cytidine 5'-diphospho)-2-C-methyl-D-erythritol kinase [Gemmatimonadota bacterium]